MRRLKFTSDASRDIKRYENNPKKAKLIHDTLNKLCNDEPLPENYYVHPLHGKYEGCLECHVQGDLLIIWIDKVQDLIKVVRIGTHHQLLGL